METENKPAEVENTQVENNPTTNTVAQSDTETPEQINWKKFREQREIERKQKIEAEKRASEKEAEAAALKAALDAIVSKPSQSNNYQTNEDSEETEEQRIARLVSQSMDAERRKHQVQQEKLAAEELPQKIHENMKDFDQVCTSENIDYLEYHYPEVAKAFQYMPDNLEKWTNVYKAVKRFVPNTDSRKEVNRAEKNFQKPQAMSIPGKTQGGDSAPQYLDDKRKMDNWQRMQRVLRGAS